jgi:hypothetical protein
MSKQDQKSSRFAGVARDPRFKRPSSKKSKTVLDSRFSRILTDKKFRGTSDTNPRGIRTVTPSGKNSKRINEDMQRFYQLAEEESEDKETDAVPRQDDSTSEAEGFRWEAESSSDEDDIRIDEHVYMEDGVEEAVEEDDVPLGDSSDRIAVMNCNWDHVTATDLFVLIESFLDANAPGRKIWKLSIHKSDFGAERLEREEQFGPLIEGMPEEDPEEDSSKTKEELKKLEDQRNAAIRRYEQSKRMYFYAIAEFDSINTACIVYDELDGVSAGFISESLDLRFVPEETPDPSEKRTPVSTADSAPSGYQPPNVEVGNLTMQHSKVTCTWDEDPPERKILMRKLTPAQIAELDLAAYLESDSEDEVDADALRKLVQGSNEEEPSVDNESSEVFGDMEMSFSRAVESVGKDISRKLNETGRIGKDDLTQWEKYLAKRKDAKKQKKLERRQQLDSQKQERIAAAKATSKSAKELRMQESKSSDDEQVDVDDIVKDSRLDKLFSDPKFAVDPTHPSFKKTSVVNELKRKNRH